MARRYGARQVDAAKEQLQALATREPARNLTLERTIRSLRADIEVALKRGNNLYEIADALKAGSVDIGVRTLKNYLRRTQKQPGTAARRRRKTPTADVPVDKHLEKQEPQADFRVPRRV